jgi:hypothetical protein
MTVRLGISTVWITVFTPATFDTIVLNNVAIIELASPVTVTSCVKVATDGWFTFLVAPTGVIAFSKGAAGSKVTQLKPELQQLPSPIQALVSRPVEG